MSYLLGLVVYHSDRNGEGTQVLVGLNWTPKTETTMWI